VKNEKRFSPSPPSTSPLSESLKQIQKTFTPSSLFKGNKRNINENVLNVVITYIGDPIFYIFEYLY